ncbi:glycerophosphodiester phosphodiesterase [Falsibacillus pallidus]|uniref:glycerophosphodiester phosphodiesterase n=1 Tax=Falsibacillus pallidus TaxID=493781 RepID=UPI003D999F9B
MTFTQIFAHRGSAGTHPENTMSSFREAEKAGADGIELDVQLSRDGEVVVIHDETLERTTNGKGFVKDYTLEELKKLDASYKFNSFLKKPRIPSFREVCEWLKTNELLCNVELKNGVFPYPQLEEKVIALVREYGLENRIIISSFNHYSIVYCFRLAPEIEIAPLYSEGLFMPWIYAQSIRGRAIHPNQRAAPDEIVLASMENGIAVRPYTVNKKEDMIRLFKIGCSAIITDYPKKALELREQFIK